MICPRCGTVIPRNRNYCETCGSDLTIYIRIMHLSNAYYNKGLERTGIRDLSGAVQMLKRSLEVNKRNTQARNLLGLVYFEMGETVAALGEWVISKHFQPEENQADNYMEQIQSAPAKLDAMNQAVKKYNIALDAAKQGGEDLAILQLKKVVSLNPRFIRARQLLALLYIHTGAAEQARKQLLRASQIDVSNTTTLRYLQEITEPQAPQPEGKEEEESSVQKPVMVKPAGNYTEDKPNVMAWVTLVVGALIGILVTFFLIVPNAERNIRAEYDKEHLDYSSELRIKEAAIASAKKEAELWKNKYEEAAKELSLVKVPEPEDNTATYDGLFSVLTEYLALKEQEDPSFDQLFEMAGKIYALKGKSFDNKDAQALYTQMQRDMYGLTAGESYQKGRSSYDNGDYEQSAIYLQAAYHYGYTSDSCYYYLGKSFQLTNDYEQAAVYYNLLLNEFPDSSLVKYARTRLSEIGSKAD